MVTFQKTDGKRVKITKKQFRNYFLKLQALKEAEKQVKIIEESIKMDNIEGS